MRIFKPLRRSLKSTDLPIGAETPEDEIAAYVDNAVKKGGLNDALCLLLTHSHPVYYRRGTNQINRIRGYILASFMKTGLPQRALIFVLEELQNSRDAYMIAASARAIRGIKAPDYSLAPFLIKALYNVGHMDTALSFETYKPDWPLQNYTTAFTELLASLRWLGAYAKKILHELETLEERAVLPFNQNMRRELKETIEAIKNDEQKPDNDCCQTIESYTSPKRKLGFGKLYKKVKQLEMEDQEGKVEKFGTFFQGSPGVVLFFYTRCDNSNKCSLNITRAAQLQKILIEKGLDKRVKLAAITYDGGYDVPERLKGYATNRGFAFNEYNRCFRLGSGDFQLIRDYFNLGVNYSGTVVNLHRVELFVLDGAGRIVNEYGSLQWEDDVVISAVEKEINKERRLGTGPSWWRHARQVLAAAGSVLLATVVAFFPKCPMCWAAYISILGVAGLQSIPYSPWLLPLLVVIMFLNLGVIYFNSKKRGYYLPFVLSVSGSGLILLFGILLEYTAASYAGICFMLLSSLLNSLPFSQYHRLMGWVKNQFGNAGLLNS